MFKKFKDFLKTFTDGEEHTIFDIDVYIPPHVLIFTILVILLALWTILK